MMRVWLHHDQPGGGLDQVLVGAVAVEEQHAPEAVVGEGTPDVGAVAGEGVPGDRDRPGEVHVVRRVAVRDGRQEHHLVGGLLGRPPADLADDAQVGVDRQVGAVVFEGGDGDQGDPVVGRRPSDLRPGQALVAGRPRPHG
jgi:hypothetical protein